ncbi:hypothetical protein Q5P01_000901 [Channa striata]|uniref:Uncharacterized protein n=1 Tax=Channa striata TaxID=64152 RepID=A0AA88LM62_CHASR|nr:hypothetical protein Q5P01_000901 [Channa striata]
MLLGHGDLDELCSHLQVYHAYRPFSTIPREELGLYGKAAPILRTLRDDHRSSRLRPHLVSPGGKQKGRLEDAHGQYETAQTRTKDITLMRHTSLQEGVETYFRNSAVHGDFRQWLVDRSDLQDKPLYPRHARCVRDRGEIDRLHWIEAAQLLNTAALVSLPESCTPLEWLRSLDPREDPGFFGLPQSNPLRRLHGVRGGADALREQHEDTKMASEFTSARPVTLRCPYEWVQITEMRCEKPCFLCM